MARAATASKRNAEIARANRRTALMLGAVALGFFIYALWRGL